jgi:hypothetical protein
MPDVRLLTPSVAVTIDMDAIVRTLDAVAREEPFPHRVFSLADAGVFAKLYELIVQGYQLDPELEVPEPPVIPPQEAVFSRVAPVWPITVPSEEPLVAKIVEAKPVPGLTIDMQPSPENVTPFVAVCKTKREGEANPV